MKAHLIRELRREKGLTLKDFATKVNIDPSNLSKIERGTHIPTLTVIERIANGLEVPVKIFF